MFELILTLVFLNFIIFLKIDRISVLINLYDIPDNKLKKHKSSTPLLGGLIFFLNLLLIFFLNYLLDLKIIILQTTFQNYLVIIFLIISFFLMGLIDDKYKLKPENKILFSIIFLIISLILNNDLLLTDLNFTFYKKIFLNNFNFFFTIFCVIILINAINFYDGINGQSIILFLIIFIFLLINLQILFFM
jgi:UDP-GlcNAc:undecaprenyl-phosphate GlcNAc-1-phosphate transferase